MTATKRSPRLLAILLVLGIALLGASSATVLSVGRTRVTNERVSWLLHELGRARIAANNPGGGSSPARSDAMFLLGLYETVNSIERKYEPFMVPFENIPASINLRKAHKVVAIAHTARLILDYLFPTPYPSEPFLHHEAAKILIEISKDASPEERANALALAEHVAGVIIANFSQDGWTAVPRGIPVVNGTKAGEWIYGVGYYGGGNPFASGYGTFVKPINRDNCAAPVFDMLPPPVFGSPAYIAEAEEVFPYGTSDPARNTNNSASFEIASFHDGYFAAGTHILYNFLTTARHNLDDVDLLRALAVSAVACNDAHMCHWYRKYQLYRGRPVTDFRLINVTEHPQMAHLYDPLWQSPRSTNNHPEYPSGHSSRTSGLWSAMRSIFGDLPFRAQGWATPYVTRSYISITDFIDDVNNARIYGGMHYRSGTDEGTRYGQQVADAYLSEIMRPVNNN